MNRKTALPIITLVCIMIINITTLMNGIRHHENYLIVMGSIGCALILAAFVVQLIKNNRVKKKRQTL
jgi:hypothetical protein